MIVDKRSGKDIEYTAIPSQILKDMDGEIVNPIIEYREEEDLDGILREYMEVRWKDIDHNDINRYDVSGHIMYAGCPKDELKCDSKGVYTVLHPIDEWIKDHIIELNKQ